MGDGNTGAAAKRLEYSPEQKAIFAVENGFYYIIANAGSGKTECSAELYVLSYLRLEKDLFPGAKEHVTGDLQQQIIRQILAVTFTKKAAQELSDRIILKLTDLGIPTPTFKGAPLALCGTLDRYLQRWVKHPAFFNIWLEWDPAWKQALERIAATLGAAGQERLKKDFHESIPLTLFRRWDSLITGKEQEAIIDLLVRLERGAPTLRGFGVADLVDAFNNFKTNLTADGDWKRSYLQKFVDIFEGDQFEMQAKARAIAPDDKHAQDAIGDWKKIQTARTEFLSIFEIARSRRYDPVRNINALSSAAVIQMVCASHEYQHIRPIHSIASAYRRIKYHLGLLDFGDYLQVFNAVTSSRQGAWLLEQKVEFPKLGFRRKVIIWDEVQDNSPPQFDLLKKFRGHNVPFLTVAVGDPMQSLYEFRGSSPYQFISDIEDTRANSPENLLSLTCSFRSTTSIVETGNNIIHDLSPHKDAVRPSRTVYQEKGLVVAAPPLNTKDDEFKWVVSRISELRNSGGGSIIILFRSEMERHPLHDWWKTSKPEDVQLMTIHGAKGLQADHVFVTGLTAGKFPDPRGNLEQEGNCMYVACTRPRRTLFLSSPMVTTVEKMDGTSEDMLMGPSPFCAQVQSIQGIFLASGWNKKQLLMGLNMHDQLVSRHLDNLKKKRLQIRSEAETVFGGQSVVETQASTYLGAISAHEEIPVQAVLPPPEATTRRKGPPASKTEIAETVLKLRKGFFRNAAPPKLDRRQRDIAVEQGWVREQDGQLEFTKDFKELLRQPA